MTSMEYFVNRARGRVGEVNPSAWACRYRSSAKPATSKCLSNAKANREGESNTDV